MICQQMSSNKRRLRRWSAPPLTQVVRSRLSRSRLRRPLLSSSVCVCVSRLLYNIYLVADDACFPSWHISLSIPEAGKKRRSAVISFYSIRLLISYTYILFCIRLRSLLFLHVSSSASHTFEALILVVVLLSCFSALDHIYPNRLRAQSHTFSRITLVIPSIHLACNCSSPILLTHLSSSTLASLRLSDIVAIRFPVRRHTRPAETEAVAVSLSVLFGVTVTSPQLYTRTRAAARSLRAKCSKPQRPPIRINLSALFSFPSPKSSSSPTRTEPDQLTVYPSPPSSPPQVATAAAPDANPDVASIISVPFLATVASPIASSSAEPGTSGPIPISLPVRAPLHFVLAALNASLIPFFLFPIACAEGALQMMLHRHTDPWEVVGSQSVDPIPMYSEDEGEYFRHSIFPYAFALGALHVCVRRPHAERSF